MISHALIDWLKPQVANSLKWKREWIFLLDQCLHIAISSFAGLRLAGVTLPNWLPISILMTVLFILLITKPTNIVFKLFSANTSLTKEKNGHDHRAGLP